MKRAAFSELAMSNAPLRYVGWFATTPTVRPSTRVNAVMTLGAYSSPISWKSPSSNTLMMMSCMSYAVLSESGRNVSRPRSDSVIDGSSPGLTSGACSWQLLGKYPSNVFTHSNASDSDFET